MSPDLEKKSRCMFHSLRLPTSTFVVWSVVLVAESGFTMEFSELVFRGLLTVLGLEEKGE